MLLALALAGAAAAQAPERLTFAVLGHLRGDGNGAQLQNLDEVIDEVARLRPDMVFLCGDLIWGGIDSPVTDRAAIEADWNALDAKLARLAVPVHRVPGNHDVCDVATRDVWLARYGPLPRAFTEKGCEFLLLRSGWWPSDGSPERHPQAAIRGVDLDRGQVEFLASRLASPENRAHAFVLAHHMLWWEDQARWWRDVQPVLAAGSVDAVFAGDYGPMKFSTMERDGVRYVQTSIENRVSLEMLRGNEAPRYLSAQLDNFLFVTVDGPSVRIEVHTVGALSSDKFTPQHYRDVIEFDKGTLRRRLFQKLGTPDKLWTGLLLVAGAGFAAGCALVGVLALLARARKGA